MSERICPNCDYPLAADERGICKPCRREEAIGWGDDDFPMTPEEEDAAEQAYLNYEARAEWSHYHPGEPCPDIELPYPPKNAALGEADSELESASQPQGANEQSP